MELITILLIALGLSFDTFAASVSLGIVKNKISFLGAVPVAFIFSLFDNLLAQGKYADAQKVINEPVVQQDPAIPQEMQRRLNFYISACLYTPSCDGGGGGGGGSE